jgi:molecular chaperone DnaK (HSP70)
VVAIDYGTTFTGVAYAYSSKSGLVGSPDEMRRAADRITVIKNWPNKGNAFIEKTPTVLAYNEQPPLWGGKVKPKDEPQVAYFKLGLYEGTSSHYNPRSLEPMEELVTNVLSGSLWITSKLPHMQPLDFTRDFLSAVIKFVTNEVLANRYGAKFLERQRILYVITVPAIWPDKAKQLTRKAAVAAGIPEDDLTLITEPEAAAIYCTALCEEVDLGAGDTFMICDAGGGTVVSQAKAN